MRIPIAIAFTLCLAPPAAAQPQPQATRARGSIAAIDATSMTVAACGRDGVAPPM